MCLYATVATKKLVLIIYLVLIISLPLMEMYYLYTGRYSAIVVSSIVIAIVALAVTCHVYRQQNSNNSHWLIAYLELSSGFLSGVVSIVAAIRCFVQIKNYWPDLARCRNGLSAAAWLSVAYILISCDHADYNILRLHIFHILNISE